MTFDAFLFHELRVKAQLWKQLGMTWGVQLRPSACLPVMHPRVSRDGTQRRPLDAESQFKAWPQFPTSKAGDNALIDANTGSEVALAHVLGGKVLGKVAHHAADNAPCASELQGVIAKIMHEAHLP